MRNVLEEFGSENYGKSKPTILGLREHIFTGRFIHLSKVLYSFIFPDIHPNFYTFVLYSSVSSLAWFMSNQETSFVTIGQRVLANPLKYVNFIFISI
jgi:callose synthase